MWTWTWSTREDEDGTTLKVGNRGQAWDLLFREVFDVLGYRLHRDGKGVKGLRKRHAKEWTVGGEMVTSMAASIGLGVLPR